MIDDVLCHHPTSHANEMTYMQWQSLTEHLHTRTCKRRLRKHFNEEAAFFRRHPAEVLSDEHNANPNVVPIAGRKSSGTETVTVRLTSVQPSETSNDSSINYGLTFSFYVFRSVTVSAELCNVTTQDMSHTFNSSKFFHRFRSNNRICGLYTFDWCGECQRDFIRYSLAPR